MDLLSFVVQPTWREFLMELIQSHQMDPWDVDIVVVADNYLLRLRELQQLDLRVPANVILASSILLRFKADALRLQEEYSSEEPEEAQAHSLIEEEIPPLIFRSNLPRARRVTLDELVSALDDVMKKGKRTPQLKVAPLPFDIQLPKETMHDAIVQTYQKAWQLKDAENIVLFSDIMGQARNAETVVLHLLPLLHLVQERRMLIWQDEVFGEIFIRVFSEEEAKRFEEEEREEHRNQRQNDEIENAEYEKQRVQAKEKKAHSKALKAQITQTPLAENQEQIMQANPASPAR